MYCLKTLCLAALLGLGATQQSYAADTPSPGLFHAIEAIAADVKSEQGIEMTDSDKSQLSELLSNTNFNPNTSTPIQDLGKLLPTLLTPRPDVDLRDVISPLFQSFFMLRDGDAGIELGQALLPLMAQSGLCHGDASSDEGLSCAFTFGDADTDIGAATTAGPVSRVKVGTLLGDLLQAALGDNSVTAQGITEHDNDSGTGSVSYTIPWLKRLGIRGLYSYYYAYQIHCATACRASVAGYGVINGQYLLTGSDMVFAAASAAMYCNYQCILGSGWQYVLGNDAVGYALRHGDKRYGTVHGPSRAVQVTLPLCGSNQGSYALSPAYQVLKDTNYELPYDAGVKLAFGTYYQAIGDKTSAAFFPKPTSTDTLWSPKTGINPQGSGNGLAKVEVRAATFQFSQLQAWSFDIIFGAVNNLRSNNGCTVSLFASTVVPGANYAYAVGNQFWVWHGGAASGDYDLPAVDIVFGIKGGHPLFQN